MTLVEMLSQAKLSKPTPAPRLTKDGKPFGRPRNPNIDRTPKPYCRGARKSYERGCRCDACSAANARHAAAWREKQL